MTDLCAPAARSFDCVESFCAPAGAQKLSTQSKKLYNGAANIILVPRITKDRREDVPWELETFHSFQTFETKSSRAVTLKSVLE